MNQAKFYELEINQEFHPALQTTTIGGARMYIKKNHKGKPWVKLRPDKAKNDKGEVCDFSADSKVLYTKNGG